MSNDDDLEKCECGFESDNIFEMFEHCEMELVWNLKISPTFSFNLYTFLKEMSRLARLGDTEEVDAALQSFTYLLFKASQEDDIDVKLKDMFVRKESEKLISELERMLEGNG